MRLVQGPKFRFKSVPPCALQRPGFGGVISKRSIALLENMAKKTSGELAASDWNVKRWHENMARSSRLSADVMLRRIAHLNMGLVFGAKRPGPFGPTDKSF